MNYRHAYHAGNFADVLKHAVLVWIVRYLQQKLGPLCLIDSHGGAGVYDLGSEQARKTGEAAGGILRLAEAGDPPVAAAPYLELVRAATGAGDITRYPGSPWLMARMLREQDRAVIGELHPEDAVSLRQSLRGYDRVRVAEGDGYALLKTSVPPPEKRGLVLIDPPFEATDEFEALARSLIAAHSKWATGVYLAWYPIKDIRGVERFHAELINASMTNMLAMSLNIGANDGLSACGLVVINPPWTLEQEWAEPLQWLARALAQGPNSSAQMAKLG